MLRLDWKEIKVLKALCNAPDMDTPSKLKNILDTYKHVFADGIGNLKGIKANSSVDENAQPTFYKALLVPFSLRFKVEAEIQRLQSEGIISPVEHSKWASPIVPVVKK